MGYYANYFATEAEALALIAQRIFNEHIPPFREEDGQLNWVEGEQVEIGFMRTYNNIRYKCIQAHRTQVDWTPNVTPALWTVIPSGKEWQPNVYYSFNCTYQGKEYICLQPHTSQVGWQPPKTPALWQERTFVVPANVAAWQQATTTPYMKNSYTSLNQNNEKYTKS
jgi:hypothetical protein